MILRPAGWRPWVLRPWPLRSIGGWPWPLSSGGGWRNQLVLHGGQWPGLTVVVGWPLLTNSWPQSWTSLVLFQGLMTGMVNDSNSTP